MKKPTISLDNYVCEKLNNASLSGNKTTFEPEEAEAAGAFFEDAISIEDAEDSMFDEVVL